MNAVMNEVSRSAQVHPDPRRRALNRMKMLALIFLLMAIAGLIVSSHFGQRGAWPWVKAFCEAAAVGALADWFAVVALFRRPLGLPIPHTALIPASKARLADELAGFVGENFLTPKTLLAKLADFDPAGKLAQWLQDEGRMKVLGGGVQSAALEGLKFLDEAAVKHALRDFVVRKGREWDASSTAGNILLTLTAGGRHHELLEGALTELRNYLGQPDTKAVIARRMMSYVKAQWPKIVSTVDFFHSVDKVAGSMSEQLANELITEVEKALSQPDHDVRKNYQQWVDATIERFKTDEDFRRKVDEIKLGLMESDAVVSYVDSLWSAVRTMLESDLRSTDSAMIRHLQQTLLGIGARVANDPSLAKTINEHVMSSASKLAVQLKDGVTHHISSTLKAWKDAELVEQLELGVGRDLQFIRLNGTLVGGAIGVAIFCIERFI